VVLSCDLGDRVRGHSHQEYVLSGEGNNILLPVIPLRNNHLPYATFQHSNGQRIGERGRKQ